MSRLLFAAARKARIEFWAGHVKRWLTVGITFAGSAHELRIHPDDAHLDYGPISTALRHAALGLEVTDSCWFSNLSVHSDGPVDLMTPHERTLFLLLTAEALAEEGL